MAEKKHLPMYGVGPMYVIVCMAVTVIGIVLTKTDVLSSGDIAAWKIPCLILGIHDGAYESNRRKIGVRR